MKVTYQIHKNIKHCSANYDGKLYSYKSLTLLLKKMNEDLFKEINSLKFNEPNVDDFNPKNPNIEFDESNLSEEERKKHLFYKKQSRAKSWISSMRRKRKSGKLTQNQIDVLNEAGMLWNPSNDLWEKNYNFIKDGRLIDYLKYTSEQEPQWGEKRLNQIIHALDWIDNQKLLFKNGNIPKENLTRLKAINFSFAESKKVIDNSTVLKLVCRINNLRFELSNDVKSFIKRYNVTKKTYVGTPLEVVEKFVVLADKKQHKKEELESNRFKKVWDIKVNKNNEKIKEILDAKSNDYFKNQIDRISEIGLLSINQMNNYYLIGEKKVFSYQKKYKDRYDILNKMMNDYFTLPKTLQNNAVHYYQQEVKYLFDDEIKEYAAKKMIHILDEFLLKSGMFNEHKSIKPISFLLNLYKKNKNLNELLSLKKLIERHELLSILYEKKLQKVFESLKK